MFQTYLFFKIPFKNVKSSLIIKNIIIKNLKKKKKNKSHSVHGTPSNILLQQNSFLRTYLKKDK